MRSAAWIVLILLVGAGCTHRFAVRGTQGAYSGPTTRGPVVLTGLVDARDVKKVGVARNFFGVQTFTAETDDDVAAAFTELVARQLSQAGFEVRASDSDRCVPVISGRLVRAHVDALPGFVSFENLAAVVTELRVELRGRQLRRTFVGLSKSESLGPGAKEFKEGFHAAALDAANQIAAAMVELQRRDFEVRP